MDQTEHAVIYTGSEIPKELPGETRIFKEAIKVIPVDEEQAFDPRSRINFARTFPVEYNVKVMEVGKVAESDMRRFIGYYKNEAEKDLTPVLKIVDNTLNRRES